MPPTGRTFGATHRTNPSIQGKTLIQADEGVASKGAFSTFDRSTPENSVIKIESPIGNPSPASGTKWAVSNSQLVAPGDILVVYLEGLLPFHSPKTPITPPPTNRIGNRVVTGYPISVLSDGTIPLPYIAPQQVAGLTDAEVVELLRKVVIRDEILIPRNCRTVVTLVKAREFLNVGKRGSESHEGQ